MTRTTVRIGPLQIGIIFLTVATALVHLYLGLTDGDIIFLLNALGYTSLLVALYIPNSMVAAVSPALASLHARFHVWIRWALVAFTCVTIIGWVLIGLRIPLAYVTKAIEVVLVVLLILEGRRG